MEDLTAHRVRPAGERPPAAADSVTLDHEGRQVRRRRLRTDAGRLLFHSA